MTHLDHIIITTSSNLYIVSPIGEHFSKRLQSDFLRLLFYFDTCGFCLWVFVVEGKKIPWGSLGSKAIKTELKNGQPTQFYFVKFSG